MFDTEEKAIIGVLGGSGNYNPEFFESSKEIKVYTPYGAPSSNVMIGKVGDLKVAFIARHGKNHTIPPSKINYRANIWALKKLGVERIISPAACGALQPGIKRGDFVVCDQLFDRTKHRIHTFLEGGVVGHAVFNKPYCPELRKIVIESCKDLNIKHHKKGTYVCMEGPHFSTTAESRFYAKQGFSVIGMTAYSEAVLAREAGICFTTIAMVTDTDAEGEEPVSLQVVLDTMKKNVNNANKLLYQVIKNIPKKPSCECANLMDNALM
jgi:5'-methylthioadenosine phosphorylase